MKADEERPGNMRTPNRPGRNLAGFDIASRLHCTVPASFLLLDSCNIFMQLEADSEVFVFFQAMISVQLQVPEWASDIQPSLSVVFMVANQQIKSMGQWKKTRSCWIERFFKRYLIHRSLH
jgi:hypothetical protein